MKIVGLTGGIGSGKTTVSKIFSSLGVPVFYADIEAKELYNNKEVIAKTKAILGEENILDKKGSLIRAKVASIIFKDEKKRDALNNFLHPLVKKRFDEWLSKQHYSYCIREAAILIESGSYKDCNKIIVVSCPMEIRINRVMQRDGISKQEVEKRMVAQMKEEDRLKYADFVIINDKNEEDIYNEVLKIHHQLI